MKKILRTLHGIILVGVLAGCGQAGPLYLPPPPPSQPHVVVVEQSVSARSPEACHE